MDALTWHQALLAPPTPPPQPMSRSAYMTLGPTERTAWAVHVQAWVGGALFTVPEVQALIEEVVARFEANRASPPGPKTIVGLTGPYGVGKSTMLFQLARHLYPNLVSEPSPNRLPEWEPRDGVRARHTPIVKIQLRSSAKLAAVYSWILDAGDANILGTRVTLEARVTHMLTSFGVVLFMLDDVHKLVETQAASRDIIEALHTLNTLIGEQGGTTMLVGSNIDDHLVLRHPQIEGRLHKLTMTPHSISTEDGRTSWQQLLLHVESVCLPYLPGAKPGFLARQLPVYLHVRTQGYMQDLQDLIKRGVRLALERGTASLDKPLLEGITLSQRAQAAETLIRSAHTRNRPRGSLASKASA